MGNTHQAQKTRLEADAVKSNWNAADEYQWGYGRERGPDTWWIYYPAASGNLQSPINLSPEEAEYDSASMGMPLKLEYPTDDGTKMVWNTGYTLQVEIRSRSKPYYVTGGPFRTSQYELRQFHLHWGEKDDCGSEHTMRGSHYSMEIHFVHWNTDKFSTFEEAAQSEGGLVILTVFAKLDHRCNPGIETLTNYVQNITYKRQFENIEKSFDIKQLFPRDLKKYYMYKGSLTTPPCYESVTWIIFPDTITVSSFELGLLRTLQNHCLNERIPADDANISGQILKNQRPIQPTCTRPIKVIEHNFTIGSKPDWEDPLSQESQYTSQDDFSWAGGMQPENEY